MKTAIYIEDGVVQLVLTPENEFEKNAIKTFDDKPLQTKINSGSFYDCRGGWVRQSAYYRDSAYGMGASEANDQSLIITSRKEAEAK